MTRPLLVSREKPLGGFELKAWVFMRLSGLFLFVLALGHFAIMHLINDIQTVNYSFVVQRYAKTFWRCYDLLMLWLALLHGSNGIRMLVDDLIVHPKWNKFMNALLLTILGFFVVLGSIVIFTFKA